MSNESQDFNPFEITYPPDGSPPSSLLPSSGSPSPPLASWAQILASSLNRLAAIGTIAWKAGDLIALAQSNPWPLLGAGIVLAAASVNAKPRDLVAAIRAWRASR